MEYKWVALSNTTLGVLLAAIDLNIVLIALPSIFRGIQINPLSSFSYLLWILFGYSIVTATLLCLIRPDLRHVRTSPPLQHGLCNLHGRLGSPIRHAKHRGRGRTRAHNLQGGPGDRRRIPIFKQHSKSSPTPSPQMKEEKRLG